MAYYLEFDGSNDYVSSGYHLDIDFTSDNYEIEFELDFTGSKNGTICSQCIENSSGNREFHLFIASSNFNVWFANAGDLVDTGYRPTSRENLILSVNVSGGSWLLTSDGSPVGSGALSPAGVTEPTATFLIGARHAGSLYSFAFFNKAEFYRLKIRKGATLIHDYDPSASGGTGQILSDTVGGNDGTLVNFPTDNSQWVFYDDGSEPELELHEFSGNAIVSALSFAQIRKITHHNGQALITASATASSTKAINVSGGVTVAAQSVSLFEKLNAFNGAASVIATSQSSASKLVVFNGQAIVNVIASASLIDGNFEIHSFSGGALITASASGQAVKIGLVSGSANVNTSTSTQASKTAQLSGNATVSTSTQSLLSKVASISGNALTRVTALASAFKRATLSGASRVFATAYGTFFNAESNVETYELTVQGRVKAPIVVQGRVKAPIAVQGRVKSLTIQGRVK